MLAPLHVHLEGTLTLRSAECKLLCLKNAALNCELTCSILCNGACSVQCRDNSGQGVCCSSAVNKLSCGHADIVYMVTGGSSLRQAYRVFGGTRSFGLSAWIVVFAATELLSCQVNLPLSLCQNSLS